MGIHTPQFAIGAQQPRPRQPRLDAIAATAVTATSRRQSATRTTEQVVAPLAGNGMSPDERSSIDHDTAADSRPQDDAENDGATGTGAICSL